jgi:hypothetical protein
VLFFYGLEPAFPTEGTKQELEMANEITPQKSNLPADMSDFDKVGATGFENVRPGDLLIPRLVIIQGLSDQIIKGKTVYDPEARVGDIYDVGLRERFPEGIEIVPAYYNKVWLEWGPERGKGLIATHKTDDILSKTRQNDMNQNVLPESGNVVVETAQFYCLNLTTPERRKSFLPMSVTMLKQARRLLTLAQSERIVDANGEERVPPLFWRSYMLTTVPEGNAKGTWMTWKIERGPRLIERDNYRVILKEVKDLREAVVEGRAHGDLGAGDETKSEAF